MLSTPYFLIDKSAMEHLVDDMSTALHYRWKNGIIGYSFKINNLPWVIASGSNHGSIYRSQQY